MRNGYKKDGLAKPLVAFLKFTLPSKNGPTCGICFRSSFTGNRCLLLPFPLQIWQSRQAVRTWLGIVSCTYIMASLPPGPPTIPILGNAHQILGQNVERKFKEWADIYGSIYSLKIGAGTLIFLNDKRTVHDLLDKRSAIYSDRAKDQQVVTALAENFAFWDANPAWRASRKLAAHFVSPKNLDETVMAVQEAEWGTFILRRLAGS